MPGAKLLAKLQEMDTAIRTAYMYEHSHSGPQPDYYRRAAEAAFVSRSHIALLGAQGTGKTQLARTIVATVDPDLVGTQQGYLSADFESTIAAPNIGKLQQGLEEVKWRKLVLARVKFVDEIQRLGPSAMSALFRLLTDGTVEYLEQTKTVEEMIVIATANPTERDTDNLNVTIPSPLWDRFNAVIWIPTVKLADQMRINGNVEKALKAIKPIWTEQDLLALWTDCENVQISQDLEYQATLMLRITNFCKYAQDYDATSIEEGKKRQICNACNQSYLCSKVAIPPSMRLKLAFLRLAKGFAYIDGRDRGTWADLEAAFPLIFWKRITFMDEYETIDPKKIDRLRVLRDFFRQLATEIREAEEPVQLALELKQQYDKAKMEALETYANSKVWLVEAIDDVKAHHESVKAQLRDRHKNAEKKKDAAELEKISELARQLLPRDDAERFRFYQPETVQLDPATLAQLAAIDLNLFKRAKTEYEKGTKTLTLTEDEARQYRMKKAK